MYLDSRDCDWQYIQLVRIIINQPSMAIGNPMPAFCMVQLMMMNNIDMIQNYKLQIYIIKKNKITYVMQF